MLMAITSAPSPLSLPGMPGDAAASTDPASGGFDFASLLLGSLAADIAASGDLLTDKPEGNSGDSTSGTPPGSADNALLLATLGLAPWQVSGKPPGGEQNVIDNDSPSALPGTAAQQGRLQTLTGAEAAPLPQEEATTFSNAFAALLGDAASHTRHSAWPAKTDNNGDKTARIAASSTLAANQEAASMLGGSRQGSAPPLASTSPAAFGTLPDTLPDTLSAIKTAFKVENISSEAPKPDAVQMPANTALALATAEITQKSAPLPQNAAWSPKVNTPLHDAAWSNDFSQKIVWLASNDQQSAQITLNPPQLGPIDISLNIGKDSATALFVSANPEVRETIEAALPRLREMLASNGIELGQASVSEQSPRQQSGQEEARPGTPRWQVDNAILVAGSGGSANASLLQRGNGLVDTFA